MAVLDNVNLNRISTARIELPDEISAFLPDELKTRLVSEIKKSLWAEFRKETRVEGWRWFEAHKDDVIVGKWFLKLRVSALRFLFVTLFGEPVAA